MISEYKPSILILDDNEDILFNIGLLLETKDYEVIKAKSANEALTFLKTSNRVPDLILSDIMMPEMDGYDFFKRLSQNPKWSLIPFVFLTAKSTPEDIRLGKLLGADDYVTKPFKEDDLLAIIQGKINRNKKRKSVNDQINKFLNNYFQKDGKFSQEGKEDGELYLFVMQWDDKVGPRLTTSFPESSKLKYSLEEIGRQLFHAATTIYGSSMINKPEELLINIKNINKQSLIYFDSYESSESRTGRVEYMLAVIGQRVSIFESLKIKPILQKLSSDIKNQSSQELEVYWNEIRNEFIGALYL